MERFVVIIALIASAFFVSWSVVHVVCEAGQAVGFWEWEPSWKQTAVAALMINVLRGVFS